MILAISFSGHLMAQGLKIIDTDLHVISEVGSEVSTPIKIQNTTDHVMRIGIERTESNIRSSQSARFCINNDCLEKNIVGDVKFVKLEPGEVLSNFVAVLETGLVPGNSSVKFRIFDVTNTNTQVEIEVNYSIKEKIKEGILFTSDVVELSDVFPNPVKEKAYFNYTYLNPDKEARLVIHSVLGSVISEFKLSPFESRLVIPVADYNPGVYFYTLYIDNEGVATKKMVIRK